MTGQEAGRRALTGVLFWNPKWNPNWWISVETGDIAGREFVKYRAKTTGWMPADIQPWTLNLRVVGSIPTRLTSLRSPETPPSFGWRANEFARLKSDAISGWRASLLSDTPPSEGFRPRAPKLKAKAARPTIDSKGLSDIDHTADSQRLQSAGCGVRFPPGSPVFPKKFDDQAVRRRLAGSVCATVVQRRETIRQSIDAFPRARVG
jgi:hypothetical protein